MMWHQSLGLQLLGFLTLILGVLLAAYAIYVRVKQTTYTEKRFSFYAFLACSMLAATMLFVLFNVSPWEPVFRYVGLPIEPTSFSDKALGVVLVLCFTALSSHWARSWNGQLTQSGGEARLRGEHTSFLSDGMEEIFRIVRRIPPESIFKANRKSFEGVRLAPPLVDLPFHEQVLDLARAAWPDLIVEANAWGAEAKSWRGILATLDQPFLVVCCVDKSEWNLSRVREQWLFEGAGDRQPRIVVVIDRLEDCELITQELRDVIPEAEVISFDALVSRALPLAQYRREIARQFAEQDLPNASFAAKEIFAAVSIRSLNMITAGRISEDEVCEEFEDHIANWIGHVGNRQLALLGDYGQGKSTAVLALTYRMLFDEAFAKSTGGRLPILIRLTGQSPKTSSPEELLSAWGGRFGLNGRALLALHRAGRTLLIFDAFDEMANVSDHADRIDHFSTLWRFACSTGKVLFTGRPNFFLDDEELKNALRVSESRASGAYCQALRIQPFSPEQMSIALRWMGPKREEFMKAVEGQSELLVLIRKPSFLFQVSRLWHLGLLKIDGGAVYSANVILDFISYSLDRQIDKQMGDVAQGPQTARFIPLRRSELEYFLCGCAIAALSSGRNNSLSAADFRGVIASLVELAPESWFGLTTHDDGSVSMTLSERMPDLDKRIESCAHAVRTHGVLEIDSARADHYKFSHKSFAEALVANAIVSAGIKDQRPITVLWRPLGTLQVMGQRVVFSFVRDISILVNSQEKLGESEVFFNLGVGSTKLLSKLSWINSRILTEIIEGPTGIVRRLRSFIRVGDAKRLEQESAYVAAISFGGSNLGQEVLINLTKGFVWAVLPMFLIVAWSIYDWFLSEAGSGFLVRVNLLPALIGVALGAFGQYFSYSYLRSRSVTFFLPAFYSRLIARPTLFAETSQRPETEAMGLSRKSHRLFIDSVIEAGLALGLLHSERRGEVQVDSSI